MIKKHFSTILADSAVGPNELEVFIEDLVAGHLSQLELAWTPFNFPVVYHVMIFQPFSILFKLSFNIAAMIGNIILVWMLISFQTWWSSYIDHCLMSTSVTEIDKENMTCHKYLIILLSYEAIWSTKNVSLFCMSWYNSLQGPEGPPLDNFYSLI